MVHGGFAAGLAQAPSVAQGDMGLSPHLLTHEIRDKWLAVSNKQSMSNDPACCCWCDTAVSAAATGGK